jgi:ParB/RepB/Spo0J family partition protein
VTTTVAPSEITPMGLALTALDLDSIHESPHNPRKHFDQAKLEQLADTIRARGIDNPVTVRYNPNLAGYELAAGHRRCRAARLAGLTAVPALIRVLDDRAFLELLHIDNLQRENLDPMDEALGYEQLLEQGYDMSGLATKLGRSVTYVASRIRLLSLGPAAREALMRGYVPLSHAIELAKLPVERQHDLLEEIFQLSVEKLAAAHAREGESREDAATLEPVRADDDDRFAVSDVADPFAVSQWETPVVPTLEELRRDIKRQLRRLKVVPWDLADATLVPEAGACATCPKRSGAAPLLFADLDTGEDACLDDRCYAAKERAFHERENPSAFEEDDDQDERAPRNVQEKRADDDWNARRKAEEATLKKKREKKLRGRTAAVRAICEAVTEFHFVTEDFLRVLFSALIHEVHDDALARLLVFCAIETPAPKAGQGFGWRMDLLKAWAQHIDTTHEQLVRAIVFAALGDETSIPMYGPDAPVRLTAFAAVLGIDVARIAAEAEKVTEKKAPKATAAKKATTSKRKVTA